MVIALLYPHGIGHNARLTQPYWPHYYKCHVAETLIHVALYVQWSLIVNCHVVIFYRLATLIGEAS